MLQLVVPMLMGMPEGLIGRDTFQVVGLMAVLVMGIAAAWIVPVAMGVIQHVMVKPVAVVLPQLNRNSSPSPGEPSSSRGRALGAAPEPLPPAPAGCRSRRWWQRALGAAMVIGG
jgi:cell division protein FtsN